MNNLKNRIWLIIIFLFFALRLGRMGFVTPAMPTLFWLILSLSIIFIIITVGWLNPSERSTAILLAFIMLLELAGRYFQSPIFFAVGCVLGVVGVGWEMLKANGSRKGQS
jgi:hypothetical protein